ncbi:MAG: hypothetical protein EBU90_30350, partial [Proteobacteria bacterium]|nr:hypothetical protein [Pseudomonadota bacterium]
GAPQARRAAQAGAMTTSENIEYGRARGNIGGTGASARDFANQAQGLGGLVRLYATYAANVFAVGAAFRALSDAMNTANMVRGLDQLGAASGRALGNLSKQLVEVTDGAISLREAMVSVAQTSSAGMSSQNILRLGAAAQKASQALGVSMGDALNRLSRGITKLEPELLDELGIFIRIDDAAEKYARQLGKTTGSLTEFERRQGFALAVLDQAEQKFNKVNLVANPYDKLAASVANLTQKLLEVINIGLGPVVNFLSQSPAALGAAILGIGTLILKQALPVLTMYREGLKKARDVSLASTAESSGEFRKSVVAAKQRALDLAEAEADARIEAANVADKKLRAIRESSFVKEKTKVLEILTKASQEVTQADLDYLTKQGDKNLATNKKLANSYYETRDALEASRKTELAAIIATNELNAAKLKVNDNVLKSNEADLNFKKQ